MKSEPWHLPWLQVTFQPSNRPRDRLCVRSSSETYTVLMDIWNEATIELYEEFYALFLDNRNGIMCYRVMSQGATCGTVVDVKHILAYALGCNATGIILAHNHPSGSIKPSQADISLTNRIVKATELMQIKVLDHLIITTDSYYSFADEGML